MLRLDARNSLFDNSAEVSHPSAMVRQGSLR